MLTNKWVLFVLSSALVLLGYFGTVDWNTMLPSQAGTIISVIGIVKVILSALMPPVTKESLDKPGNNLLFQFHPQGK